jgi:ABC-type uncharacterized transport system permease subunit
MKKWFANLLWDINIDLLTHRISEALREMAVLWLVFAMLDKLVANELTASWMMSNCVVCIAGWIAGFYIEMTAVRRQR